MTVDVSIAVDLLWFLFRALSLLIAAAAAIYLGFAIALTITNAIVSLAQPPDRDIRNGL